MTGKMIKAKSRALNRKNHLKSMFILLSGLIIVAIMSIIPFFLLTTADTNIKVAINIILLSFCTLISGMFYASYSTGEAAWYSGRHSGKKNCFKRLVYWFLPSHSFKAFLICSIVFILKLCWCFILCTPGLLTILSVIILSFTGGVELYLFLSLLIGSFMMFVCGLTFSFIINQRYFLTKYLIVDNPQLGIIQVIKQSKNLTEGQLFKIVRFKLNFIPTFLLYPLIVPIIYFYPHYKQSRSIIAKELYI